MKNWRAHFKRTDLFVGLALLITLAVPVLAQMGMKSAPQLILLAYGLVTIFFLIKSHKIGSIMFLMLTGLGLFIIGLFLTNVLLDIFNPDRGWALDNNGQRIGRVMDFSIFWGVPVGIILALCLIRLYTKKIKRNNRIEIACVSLYTVATVIIYLIYEI